MKVEVRGRKGRGAIQLVVERRHIRWKGMCLMYLECCL